MDVVFQTLGQLAAHNVARVVDANEDDSALSVRECDDGVGKWPSTHPVFRSTRVVSVVGKAARNSGPDMESGLGAEFCGWNGGNAIFVETKIALDNYGILADAKSARDKMAHIEA